MREITMSSYKTVPTTKSLARLFPKVAKQWHPTKNGKLTADDVAAKSSKKVWWKCPKGPDHEWLAKVASVTRAGNADNNSIGCPFCHGTRVSVTTSLRSRFPEIAKEWHPSKNGALIPEAVSFGSSLRAWWKCPEGPDHVWQAIVCSRTGNGRGCPYCDGKKVSVTNSLKTLFPQVARQWHPTKNGKLTPDQTVAGSHKKVWWKCLKGPDHEWQAIVYHRTYSGSGCAVCDGKIVSVSNCLKTLFPAVARQWHRTRNGDITPKQVHAGSQNKYWWKCPMGPDHEWESTVASRTGNDRGCPYCYGKKASVTNSLKSLFPNVARQWHPTKNGNLTPATVVAGSNKKYWWKCLKGPDHEWRTSASDRSKTGCPCCSGNQVSITNCLATRFPDVAREWHPTKNGKLKPEDVTYGSSHRKYWWLCSADPTHEYRATCKSRTNMGSACPKCNTLKGEKAVRAALDQLGCNYYEQHLLPGLRNPLSGAPLRIDFFVPRYKLVIEYDGQHHFKPIRYSYSITQKVAADLFALTQQRDRIKNRYCRKCGFTMLRIPFTQLDDVPALVTAAIQKARRQSRQGSHFLKIAKLHK